ncbi:MAG: peptide MFS transporter [Bacteroidaceae bacterium]|nr:peptide MFS transporter [Bacteroidaceae bacterium]MBQ3122191.1 peptide MFS transporter [Bacteroidaceae bacterium]MBQ3538545.1 peptide MFS transporter [Bacteroidaceae bacterium]MBQ6694592.1 peptide MFS transporter [Bacteroidaceae bacterium]
MFEGQPKGLFAMALANTGERFGYYTMLAVFVLFMQENFGMSADEAGNFYSAFLAFVYFLPFVGGILADKFGYGKMVTIGIIVMFFGYLLLAVPLGAESTAYWAVVGALALISIGTGLFKGNLQVMVGNLYDDPKYANKRDAAFSLFYMAINIGALFAPTAAVEIMRYAQNTLGYSVADSYHFAFAVACASLIVSIAIYYAFRSTFKHVEGGSKKVTAGANAASTEELSPAETKARVVALCLVFAVVIFFWMAFHQNGLTLTLFANEFTAKSSTGVQGMLFSVWNLVAVIAIVYAAFSFFQSKTAKAKGFSAIVVLAALGFLGYQYSATASEIIPVSAPIFQQFNPFYVVALTPVSMAIFSYLASKGKEPSAPRKIAYGMLVAAAGFVVMAVGSMGLLTPNEQAVAGEAAIFVSPNWLISTYLVLTFGELLLSPMGISFVSKVAPPKLKGMMMGGWFVATALGNYLTKVGSMFWGDLPLVGVWAIFIVLCLLSALFMFIMMKRLEKVAK